MCVWIDAVAPSVKTAAAGVAMTVMVAVPARRRPAHGRAGRGKKVVVDVVVVDVVVVKGEEGA